MIRVILGCGLLIAACGGPTAPAPAEHEAAPAAAAAPASRAIQAATLANAIAAAPDRADAILADAGVSPEAFEALMYDIAADPSLSADYAALRER